MAYALMGKRGAMEMGRMHFIVEKGHTQFWGKGDNSVLGNHKGLPVRNGQMRFLGKGECDSPVQMGQTQFPIPLGRGRYVGAYGIRPDGQTWGDKMGGMHLGEWATIRFRATTRDCPYEMGKCDFGERANVAYPNDWTNAIYWEWATIRFRATTRVARTKWANAIWGNGRTWHTQMIGRMRFIGERANAIRPYKWGKRNFPYHWGVGDM